MEDLQRIALTVIVPCYNVENCLDRSLGCLERQWLERKDYEIILVNDASSDSTADKLHEFQLRHPDQVVVIDNEINEGVAVARNKGLDVAHGEWIAFFDPDDALIDAGYARLLDVVHEHLNELDVLSFGVTIVDECEWNDMLTSIYNNAMEIEQLGNSKQFLTKNFSGVCWKYLFKRDVLKDRRFQQLSISEDYLFVLSVFLSDVRVGVTCSKVYFYIQRPSSVTNTMDSKRLNKVCDDLLTAVQTIGEYKESTTPEIQNILYNVQINYTIFLFSRLLLSDKCHKELKQVAKTLKDISVLPLCHENISMAIRNFVLNQVWIIQILRPLYRVYRYYKKNI